MPERTLRIARLAWLASMQGEPVVTDDTDCTDYTAAPQHSELRSQDP